jgi:transketolase
MRDAFLGELYRLALKDRDIVLVSDDLGYPLLDDFRKNLSAQYINIGIAEQNMISVAAGLALGGKKVFTYGIAPFVSLRCYEQIRIDLCMMNLPVTCLAIGAGYSYDNAGPTHHVLEDIAAMNALPNLSIFNPSDSAMAAGLLQVALNTPGPKYIRLDRFKLPDIHTPDIDLSEGIATIVPGDKLTIIATGYAVHQAIEVSARLHKQGILAGVVDLYRIKPLNEEALLEIFDRGKPIITIEENSLIGGIGSLISCFLLDRDIHLPFKRLGISDKYYFEYGGREALHKLCGLDVDSIVNSILEWFF